MSKFRSYIRKLENKKDSFFKIYSLIFLGNMYWGKDVLRGEIISVGTDSIQVRVNGDFNKPYQPSEKNVSHFSISLLKTKYNKSNSYRLFLEETGEELPQEMLI